MTIKSLTIQGYRSIQYLQLPLQKVNVITGSNGCGKSNLYKAVHLLAKAASGELSKTLAQEGGLPSVLWAGKKMRQFTRAKEPVRLVLSLETDEFNYEIACGIPIPIPGGSAFLLDPEVKEEYVWHGHARRPANTFLERKAKTAFLMDQHGSRCTYPISLSHTESALSQLQEPHLYPELSSLCTEIKKWRFYHHFRTDADSLLRMPQVGVRTTVLSNDGHDLAAALQTIIEVGDSELLDSVVDRAFPGSKLLISIDHKTRFEVQLQMPSILRPLEARELSDGTLRYLCLIAALLSPRPAPMVALNEPEMSLHAGLMQPLAELITEASRYSQIWVTTHSEELAHMISKAANTSPINLVRTEDGTQLEGDGSFIDFLR